jgi:hypothetical protein
MTEPSTLNRQTSKFSVPFWLGLFLFAVYLLSFSGKLHVSDELMGFATANSLVQHGRPDVNPLIWTNHWQETRSAFWGLDHSLYSKKAPGLSLAAAPFIWLGHTLPGLNALHTGLLLNALVTALTAGLLFIWLTDLGFTRLTATLSGLAYGLGTIAWVYARFLWGSTLLAFIFLATMWGVNRFNQTAPARRPVWLLFLGLMMAAGLLIRFELAAAAGFVGLYLLWRFSNSLQSPERSEAGAVQRDTQSPTLFGLFRLVALYGLPILLAGLSLLYFNYSRFGSFTETGYSNEMSFSWPWVGSYGLLFSPGRGLFIYSPLMILLFFGLRPAWRRLPRPYFGLIAVLCLSYWLFYGSWFAWGGTWGWGPRFIVPLLPLLMLFVAEVIEKVTSKKSTLGRSAIGLLAAVAFFVNILAITVDFNEHYMRLGRNDNFIFNWQAMPLLGHWRILQEGLVDLIWLRPAPAGFTVDWVFLMPALFLLAVSAVGLWFAWPTRPTPRQLTQPSTTALAIMLTAALTVISLRAAAYTALQTEQAQADTPLLQTLTAQARPNDALLISMPPFGDVQEISTRMMSALHTPLPIYAWIESEPRAIQPDERDMIWQSVQTNGRRAWLFERWLTPADPLSQTADHLNREAYPLTTQWFDHSGRLTLYTLPNAATAATVQPLDVPFQGGIILQNFAVEAAIIGPGETVKVRLTWQAPPAETLAEQGLPNESIISFVHLLDESGGRAAQQDRLLADLQNVRQSPLLPGQTVPQGYGLALPNTLPPGSYPLIAGLYGAAGGQRLPRADDSPDDFIYLTTITVK